MEIVPRYMEEYGLDFDAPTVVLQHCTKGPGQLDGIADFTLCGHMHCYWFAFIGDLMHYTRDISYGYRIYGTINTSL